jgi:hypothetical protein
MNISIECLAASAEAACQVRQQVFGREWRVTLPQLSEYPPERQLTLVVRDRTNQEPVAALTVVETTGDAEMHGRLGLSFFKGERTARYTQLAVLKPYRGMNLPVRLILTARRRFVGPKQIRYTWLLFDAEHAKTSSLCSLLGFGASRRRFLTEYGCSRVLTRDEATTQAELCDRRAQSWLEEVEYNGLAKRTGAGSLEAR